jgi:hypothetical protein
VSHVTLPIGTVAPEGRESSIHTSSVDGGDGCDAKGVVHCAQATGAKAAKTTRDTNNDESLMLCFTGKPPCVVVRGRP